MGNRQSQSIIFKTTIFLTLIGAMLSADEIYNEGIFIDTPNPPFYPFSITADWIWVNKADFYTPSAEGQKLHYEQTDVALTYTQPLNEFFGLIFGSGYVNSIVDWKENPDFTETNFNYVSFSIGTFTTAFPNWQWSALFNLLIDTEVFDLDNYALYQAIAWGKYRWNDALVLQGGFILEVGLNKDKIWPIIGFQWNPNPEKWVLTVIYPIDISFNYYLRPCVSIGTSVRFLRNRHRVRESEPLPQAIFEYQTAGLEFDLNYLPFDWVIITGFVGSTTDGDLKITNSTNHDATHYKFHGSFYAGVSAELSY